MAETVLEHLSKPSLELVCYEKWSKKTMNEDLGAGGKYSAVA
jgi:hypothetical protein